MARKVEPGWSSWRDLGCFEARVNHLPEFVQEAVRRGHKARWSYPHSRMRESCRDAIYQTLDEGTEIPSDTQKTLKASLRSKYGERPDVLSLTDLRPHEIVLLYSSYGLKDPLGKWRRQRSHYQGTQKRWTSKREEEAAEWLKNKYGGFPGIHVIQSDFSALANRLPTIRTIDAFCSKHGLIRATNSLPAEYWKDEAYRKEIADKYLNVVLNKGRYVRNYELSESITAAECGGTPPNTLRVWINKSYGSVKALFEKFVATEQVPKAWKITLHQHVTNDGTRLDSSQEVWFYEIFLSFLTSQNIDSSPFPIERQALIPGSTLRADFLIAKTTFVEILRYNLDELETWTKKDAVKYKRLHATHMDAYHKAGIKPVIVQPHELKHDYQTYDIMERIVRQVDSSVEIDPDLVHISDIKACGWWFREHHRDEAIDDIIAKRKSQESPYKYPTHAELEKHAGGLLAYLKHHSAKGVFDAQAEALRIGCVASDFQNRPSTSPIRVLTSDEMIELQRRHNFEGDDHKRICELFGKDSLYYVLNNLDPEKSREEYTLPGLRRVLVRRLEKGEASKRGLSNPVLIDPAPICNLGNHCRCLPTARSFHQVRSNAKKASQGKVSHCRMFQQRMHWELLLKTPEPSQTLNRQPAEESLGRRIAFLMQLQKVTGNELCSSSTFPRRKLLDLILDHIAPTEEQIHALAEALSIPIECLRIQAAFLTHLRAMPENELCMDTTMPRSELLDLISKLSV